MEHIFIILNIEDISVAQQVAATLATYKTSLLTPYLIDRIMISGLQNPQLITWDDCLIYAELDSWAHRSAFELETKIEAVAQQNVPHVSIFGWQHLSLYYLMMTVKWYNTMWEGLIRNFHGATLHVFVCDNPLSYYFNSFIPSTILVHCASKTDRIHHPSVWCKIL